MTKEEWIRNNNSFYHITKTSNITSILANGLQRGSDNPYGICVIRSNHSLIIEYLIQMMLFTTNETIFSIIKISPERHQLLPHEIINDHVVEATNPLHNYIQRNLIVIDENDIVGTHNIIPGSIHDFTAFSNTLVAMGLIESLEQ
jgi:hypothetical protein